MFKPVQSPWKTSITKVEPNKLTTRGHKQENVTGGISFSEMVYLLVKGDIPSEKNKKMLKAILVFLQTRGNSSKHSIGKTHGISDHQLMHV